MIRPVQSVQFQIPAPLDKHTSVGLHPVAPNPVVAIDPGVRTFGTLFDPTNQQYIEWGHNDMGHIYRLCQHMDKLQSRIYRRGVIDRGRSSTTHRRDRRQCIDASMVSRKTRTTTDSGFPSVKPDAEMSSDASCQPVVRHHQRWRMKRALRRMRQRVQNLVKDFHFKYAKWLCMNYQVILLPYFDTRSMVRRGLRRIRNKTVRALTTWSPCTFRDRLLGMSRRFPGCHVIQLSEAYTSKTCILTYTKTLNKEYFKNRLFDLVIVCEKLSFKYITVSKPPTPTNKIADMSFSSDDEIDDFCDGYGATPLHYEKDEHEIRKFIKKGENVNARTYDQETPLHRQTKEGSVRALIEAGVDINAQDHDNNTPLHSLKDPGAIRALIESGADVNIKNRYGNTPLHCRLCEESIIDLIKAGCDVNDRNVYGRTPLYYQRDEGAVRLLIGAGADVRVKSIDNTTPLYFRKDEGAIRLLVKAGIDVLSVDNMGNNPLHHKNRRKAASTSQRLEDEREVRLLIEYGVDPKALNSNNETPLNNSLVKDVVKNMASEKITRFIRNCKWLKLYRLTKTFAFNKSSINHQE